MSCGFLHFNPLASACDWPANVINIRPECDKTFKTFNRRRKQFGQKINASKSGASTKDDSDTTLDEDNSDEGLKAILLFAKRYKPLV